MRGALVALAAGLALGAAPAAARAPDPPPAAVRRHDLHLSHTRLAVEGATVGARIRLFRDDLERALRRRAGDSALALSPERRREAEVERYLRERLRLDADGARLALRVTGSGYERDAAQQDVLWYVLEGEAARPIARLRVLVTACFELFGDQQNVVALQHFPDGRKHSFFFAAGDEQGHEIAF